MNKNHVIGVVILLAGIAGASFWGGMAYASKGVSGARMGAAAGMYAGQMRGGRGTSGFAGAVFGTIVSKDPSGITVQLGGPNATSTNGTNTGSRIVLISDATQIGKFMSGSASDLAVGESVTVQGTPNSDGSITATQVQIRPAGQTTPRR